MENNIITESTKLIRKLLIKLIDIVIKAHEQSKKAISSANGKIALDVLEQRDKFEKEFMLMESEILFALTKKPLAIELRRTITYLIVAKELESIINYSKKIAKFTISNDGKISPSSQTRIRKVHKPLRTMLSSLRGIIDSENENEIIFIAEQDNEIDEETLKIRKAIVNSVINKTDKELIKERVYVLNIVNSLEKAGDHIVSICENLLYIKTNKHIKL
ncbi:phosphate signaling complex PhoU family protein [Mycoplasma todarodis]|uniref:PhoU domain-containing protein n=1 Tax=Mycoplasma todarodis TaxID=1937191 RepID=A0A4R0XQF1_9MOLU|nr:PhoU domain-containing protein [Mycoplasma todarodis]TCG11105.1 hypothetical protein C4B25_02330 [Mycoplasma todarodis]